MDRRIGEFFRRYGVPKIEVVPAFALGQCFHQLAILVVGPTWVE